MPKVSISSDALMNAVDMVGADLETIRRDAREHTFRSWKRLQLAKAATLGACVAVIPASGAVLLPAELLALLRVMHRGVVGVCAIHHDYVDEEQFPNVLGVWSGHMALNQALAAQIATKAIAHTAYMVGGPTGVMLASKAFASTCETLVAKKLGPKIAQKVAAKLAAKIGAKLSVSWIPVVSAAVGAGVNCWIVGGLIDAADEYCRFMTNCAALVPLPAGNGDVFQRA
jgi:hypothetical protein